MHQKIKSYCIIFLFLFLLANPDLSFTGAKNGILLWYNSLLPTIFPFLFFTNMLLYGDSFQYLTALIGPALSRIFAISPASSFAVICGFVCGYPMGGKVANDLYKKQCISYGEYNYLLSFCNNVSPAFLIGFIFHQKLQLNNNICILTALFYLAPILCSFLFRIYWKGTNTHSLPISNSRSIQTKSTSLIQNSLMNSMETIIMIGGYVMLFSIMIQFIQSIFQDSIFSFLLCGFLEITNGITLLSQVEPLYILHMLIIVFLSSFGGICAACQTVIVCKDAPFSVRIYIIEKLVTSAVTSFLYILYFNIHHYISHHQ